VLLLVTRVLTSLLGSSVTTDDDIIAPTFVFSGKAGKEDGEEHAVEELFSLDVDGFEIIRGGFAVSEAELDALLRHAMSGNDVIFNNASVGDEENDGLRSQVPFEKFVPMDDVAAALQQRLNVMHREMYPQLTPNDTVILRSDAGCADQRSHTDYTPIDLRMPLAGAKEMPLASVVALMANTFFDVWVGAVNCFGSTNDRIFRHRRLVLNAGDMLIFRGDLVHAGAGFGVFNIRIHTYLDAAGVRRAKNTTFYVDAAAGCDYVLPREI